MARDTTPYQNMSELFKTRNVDENATHLKQHIKSDSKVLDVGCGPGSITIGFAKLCPDGNVVGVDINQESLSTARQLAEDVGVHNITFKHEDASETSFLSSFADDTFDIVHAHQVLLHLKDPVSALREMRRVVKPGGIVSSRDNTLIFFDPPSKHMQASIDDVDRHLIPNPGGGRRNHIWASEAGFEWPKITVGSATWDYSSPSKRQLVFSGSQKGAKDIIMSKGLRDEAFFEAVAKDWMEWVQKPEARAIGLDGWVLAEK